MKHEQRVEGCVKEASEKNIGSKNKVQTGTTSTLGSLDSPYLGQPRIGKPACSLNSEISGNIFFPKIVFFNGKFLETFVLKKYFFLNWC